MYIHKNDKKLKKNSIVLVRKKFELFCITREDVKFWKALQCIQHTVYILLGMYVREILEGLQRGTYEGMRESVYVLLFVAVGSWSNLAG